MKKGAAVGRNVPNATTNAVQKVRLSLRLASPK